MMEQTYNTKRALNLLLALLCSNILIISSSGCFSSSSGNGTGEDGTSIIDEDLELKNNAGRFKDGNIPAAAERSNGLFQDIHFAYNSSSVDSNYHEMLKMSAKELINDPSLKAEVEGHCDNRGTPEYNLALGEERARSAQKILLQFGANPSQINIISYGEEIPLDPGSSESSYAKNRRVHFALYKEGKRGNQ